MRPVGGAAILAQAVTPALRVVKESGPSRPATCRRQQAQCSDD